MDRVLPVVAALSKRIDIPLSIDTTKAAVAEEAIKSGASIINDISALRFDAAMARVAAGPVAPLCSCTCRAHPSICRTILTMMMW